MPIYVIDKIKPKNAADFPVADASDVQVGAERLTVTLNTINNRISIAEADIATGWVSNWNETDASSQHYIANKPALAAVATSGNYTDLSDTPSVDANVSTTSTNAVQNAAIANYVNSAIETSTAAFKGTFESKSAMDAVTADTNDYAFLVVKNNDNTINHYEKYKWSTELVSGSHWVFEYNVNNSTLTSEQWSAINSGVTSTTVAQVATNASDIVSVRNAIPTVDTTTSTTSSNPVANNAITSMVESRLSGVEWTELETSDAPTFRTQVLSGIPLKWGNFRITSAGGRSDGTCHASVISFAEDGKPKLYNFVNEYGSTRINMRVDDLTYETLSAAQGDGTLSLVTTGEKYIWNAKQDALIAGSNITLSNGTISATDTTYESKAAADGGTDLSLVTTGEKWQYMYKEGIIGNLPSDQTITSFVDGLSRGVYHYFLNASDAPSDTPTAAGAIVVIYVLSSTFAEVVLYAVASGTGRIYQQSKTNGVWRGWYSYEGKAVST